MDISVDAPDPEKFRQKSEILGTSAMLVSVLYRRQEFFRCGYFVYNDYVDERIEKKGEEIQVDKIVRSILIKKPRTILKEIMWDYSSTVKMVQENISKIGNGKNHEKAKQKKERRKPRISKKKQAN